MKRARKPRGGRPPKPEGKRLGTQVTIRLDERLLARLEAHVERLTARNPAVVWTRGAAIRWLMNEGLRREEGERPAYLQDKIMSAIRESVRDPSGRVPLADVRRRLFGHPREAVDTGLLALEREGAIALDRGSDLADMASLTASDRRAAIFDGTRGHLAFVTLR